MDNVQVIGVYLKASQICVMAGKKSSFNNPLKSKVRMMWNVGEIEKFLHCVMLGTVVAFLSTDQRKRLSGVLSCDPRK
jgi:hypothetical protein